MKRDQIMESVSRKTVLTGRVGSEGGGRELRIVTRSFRRGHIRVLPKSHVSYYRVVT